MSRSDFAIKFRQDCGKVNEQINNLVIQLEDFVNDKSNSLYLRWKTYLSLCKEFEFLQCRIVSGCIEFESLVDVLDYDRRTAYSNLGWEQGEIIYVESLVKNLTEIMRKNWNIKIYELKRQITKQDIDNLKEEILQKGIFSFENSW